MSDSDKVIPELLMDLPAYETYYNGSIPYNVYVNDDKGWLSVYGIPKRTIWVDSEDEESFGIDCVTHIENTSLRWDKDVSSYYNKLLLKCYFTELFVGKDPLIGYENSVLMKNMNGSYTYIGDRVYNFSVPTDDTIIDFHSPIHDYNSYPVAIGKKNVYLLLHGIYIDKSNIYLEEDKLYDTYIDFYYKYNHSSSNTMFTLCDNIKKLDNGYYFQCDDLLEHTIISHTDADLWNGLLQKYDVDMFKFIVDQVNETEIFKKILYSMYDIDSESDREGEGERESDSDTQKLKDELKWVSEYISSLICTI